MVKEQDRWLSTASALFVNTPEIKPPSILSYPVVSGDPSPVVGPKYERALPFLAQQVIDLGYELPKPFGIAVIPVWVRQDLILQDLAISVDNGPVNNIDFIDYGTPWVDTKTLQVKFDAWIFPFLNAYATMGWLDGNASIPLTIQGKDLADSIDPTICSGLLQPDLCVRTLSAEAKPNYYGENFTLGINLATGWKKMFVAIPITYAWTEVNIIDSTIEALNISPRIGVTSDMGTWGAMSTYIGATYLDAEIDITGSVTFDTPDSGVPVLGDTTTVDYKITQKNKDKWNYLIGFNWDITKNWSAQAEAGFGGSRSNLISSATYRF